jgi:antagonist of KipI
MLKVLEPGILTTIQDAGRWGYQAYGVPVSGAMDLFALHAANDLVGNPLDEAVLEICSPITLQAYAPYLIAVTGADAQFQINDIAMPQWTSIFVRGGAIIKFVPRRIGGWVYLAVHGGIDVPRVLGSRSTYLRGNFGGLAGRALAVEDAIPIGAATLADLVAAAGRGASERVRAFANRLSEIRVVLGPHNDWFVSEAIAVLTSSEYVVTDAADRMGYRLRGAALARRGRNELVSCGVPLGALQVPPDGQPIVLMADHQTTGGYPILATVIAADVRLVAQRAAGERLTFKVVGVEEAQRAWLEMQALFAPPRKSFVSSR